jgi:hypothetical protein
MIDSYELAMQHLCPTKTPGGKDQVHDDLEVPESTSR